MSKKDIASAIKKSGTVISKTGAAYRDPESIVKSEKAKQAIAAIACARLSFGRDLMRCVCGGGVCVCEDEGRWRAHCQVCELSTGGWDAKYKLTAEKAWMKLQQREARWFYNMHADLVSALRAWQDYVLMENVEDIAMIFAFAKAEGMTRDVLKKALKTIKPSTGILREAE